MSNKIALYGIKNCDTMKKALKWLDNNDVEYQFHDYKKEGADQAIIQSAINQCGWEQVINRRGTTWRKLDDQIKETMDAKKALEIALENASIVKRPLLVKGDQIHLGFKEDEYQKILG